MKLDYASHQYEELRNSVVYRTRQHQKIKDRLSALFPKTRVSSYNNEFFSIMIDISGIRKDENPDKLCAGLKPLFRLEALKAGPSNLKKAVRTALKIDSGLYHSMMLSSFSPPLYHEVQKPMDSVNEKKREISWKGIKG